MTELILTAIAVSVLLLAIGVFYVCVAEKNGWTY